MSRGGVTRPNRAGVLWPGTIGVALTLTLACSTGSTRLHPYHIQAGALRMAEVVGVAAKAQIRGGWTYEVLVRSGVNPSQIQDGSLAGARVYCCGGPNEEETAILFYVPNGMSVEAGDIVEVRMGRQPDNGDPGAVNTLAQIRQKRDAKERPCRWVPPNPRLWVRMLYCDWMPQEGWVERTGMWKAWYKPVP